MENEKKKSKKKWIIIAIIIVLAIIGIVSCGGDDESGTTNLAKIHLTRNPIIRINSRIPILKLLNIVTAKEMITHIY